MTVRKATQFTVCVPDEPGKLAEATEFLAKSGVNLVALAGWTEGEGSGVIACIPEDPDKHRALECPEGCESKETEVVVVEGDDKLGVGHAISKAIANAGVNINACMMQAAGGQFQAVVSVDQPAVGKVLNALANLSGCGCSCSCTQE